jgi:hypothetical protein
MKYTKKVALFLTLGMILLPDYSHANSWECQQVCTDQYYAALDQAESTLQGNKIICKLLALAGQGDCTSTAVSACNADKAKAENDLQTCQENCAE